MAVACLLAAQDAQLKKFMNSDIEIIIEPGTAGNESSRDIYAGQIS